MNYGDNGSFIPKKCGTCSRCKPDLNGNPKCDWPVKFPGKVVPTWVRQNITRHPEDGVNCTMWVGKYGLT